LSTFSDDIASSTLGLARSLWAELGVGDAPRLHDWQALDLEPLIIFTARCVSGDGRLRARTIEWCAANGRYVSAFRLHNFSRQADAPTRGAAERYLAAVNPVAPAALRSESPPASRRARPSMVADLRRPALIQLRLRAMVGVSARAEILKLLLADPDRSRTASSLVARAGYGKGGVAQALDMLTVAGITTVKPAGNRFVYKLGRPAELAQALNGLPESFPDWWAAFKVIEGILRYARGASREPARRVASTAKLVHDLKASLETVPTDARPPRISGPSSIAAFEQLARAFVSDLAGANPTLEFNREVVYTVHRLLLGGWIATVKEAGDQPRPLALSDDPELQQDRRAHRRMNLDEIGAAADVIQSMLVDMRTRDVQRSQGSRVRRESVSDSLLPAMSREFASELLQPMNKGQSANFTEEFLQRWFTNRRRRFSAAG
jgi:DNA-binding transcriptional ArsR family regulator